MLWLIAQSVERLILYTQLAICIEFCAYSITNPKQQTAGCVRRYHVFYTCGYIRFQIPPASLAWFTSNEHGFNRHCSCRYFISV